ncbi:MAG TPA: RluB protein [Candidatus Mediterraneibacter intestinavium]|nr:RluB protein [Candidatus Mediterraneibacter intestinavium]
MRRYIAFDKTNQYLIMGRNTDSLLLSRANLYELDVTSDGVKTKIRLKSYRG